MEQRATNKFRVLHDGDIRHLGSTNCRDSIVEPLVECGQEIVATSTDISKHQCDSLWDTLVGIFREYENGKL